MHPRNPYFIKKPDFVELAKKHAFLAPFVSLEPNKRRIDFKNKDALRALTRALLLEDFGLDVVIPLDSLVPMVPQRLNYILWIEDLIKDHSPEHCGLDIGTGGTAIYALLCARKNNWRMHATDVVEESVEFAKKNVERNGLGELVTVQLTQETPSSSFFAEITGKFHFSLCNPPFFSSEEETESLGKARTLNRPLPSAAKTGTSSELVATGGERDFISKMIAESSQFPGTVGIFTTMVGIKADLKFLTDVVKANNALAYTTGELEQGKTMRWVLAWTFDPEFVPRLPLRAPHYAQPVPVNLCCDCTYRHFLCSLKNVLAALKFRFLWSMDDRIEVMAEKNTWSNQRQKLRAKRRNEESGKELESRTDCSVTSISDEHLFANLKDYEGKDFPLHFEIIFVNPYSSKEFLMRYLGGNLGVNGIHQVIQYLKHVYNDRRYVPDPHECGRYE